MNVFIQEFLKSRPKEVQNKLLFIKPIDKKLAINKDERFHITTRNQFIKNWANKVDKSQSIFVNLYLFANMMVVYNHRYYSDLIYKLVARLIVLTQIDNVYTQDKIMWLGYPLNSNILGKGNDLPEKYQKDELALIEMIADKLKVLSKETNKYPWSVLKQVDSEIIVDYIKKEVDNLVYGEEIKNSLKSK